MNLVKLAQRHVINSFPRFAAVVSDTDTAVLPMPHSFWIFRIDPECVEVDMAAAGDRTKSLASVNGREQRRRNCKDAVLVCWIDADGCVVKTARDDIRILRDHFE